MTEHAATPLDAGDFSSWLTAMQAALRGERDATVPCEGCTACCTSSQFVHVDPDESATLARIPVELQFPAPGLPPGHVVLGYDEHGHCPMFVAGACSIYEDRPRACRTYDCRVFPAAGVQPDADKPSIARQASRWVFSFDEAGLASHDAVVAAARARRDAPESTPRPPNPTRLAVTAIEIHERFG